ncbi:integrase, catalytic region, zinc finger, CCHC-type containing protein [Tanacetum coccineum]
MTGDRSRLRNFMKKFIGTVRFGKDHFGAIMCYGDYAIGESMISRVYYVEGLGHNLHVEVLPNLLVVQSLQEQIMVVTSAFKPLELRPMRVQTINGKKYILVIVDDYLRSKDDTPEVVIKFLKQIQVGLNKTVRNIHTDNGTEFVNKNVSAFFTKRQFRGLHSRKALSKDGIVLLLRLLGQC